MSFSNCASYFSKFSFFLLKPSVSTIRTCAIFWYYLFTCVHFSFKPSLNSINSSSDNIFLTYPILTSSTIALSAMFESSCTHRAAFALFDQGTTGSDHNLSFFSSPPTSEAVSPTTGSPQLHLKRRSFYLISAHELASHWIWVRVLFCVNNHMKNYELY